MDATTNRPATVIAIAQTPCDVAAVKAIFRDYADYLGEDLCFQGFEQEMATFPAIYDFLLFARSGDAAAGAVALKNLGGGDCEMKRLYVRPDYQGDGLGRRLCVALIDEARRRSYRVMRLDTLARLASAVSLYRSLGFVETPRYYENPLGDVIYMALPL